MISTTGTRQALRVEEFPSIVEGRYLAKIARNNSEVETALRLRHRVFNLELAARDEEGVEFETDKYDLKCKHLVVIDTTTNETVGTYRLNSIETAHSTAGFYSAGEFTIEDLPDDVIENGIEIGRACIDAAHRNTKVLFLLWKAMLVYQRHVGKRYFFGCCSIFTTEMKVGENAFWQLKRSDSFDEKIEVLPRRNGLDLSINEPVNFEPTDLPALFNMYLRLGARVCGPPTIDREFGSIDFFVVFDVTRMPGKYQKMFF